ncbi:ubiquitin carboxyl-terminal hydrolase-like protein isozyme L3 [Massarina eburnea CBS 473.64]|uniref:Ubiquitin carboxyl-terminal hydrolase n=1 Tax=Massarina eburnea CBS 473.64 TaxID=1395130 RepID=A0A6A6S6L1_9PLEO|nr:ubiquitin carboxyl-terminal hydrolase-like protein isozyme L3 [Massarina eburnea CBS 473.64]
MPPKMWVVLENNPQVMNHLAHSLGLSKKLAFHDIYSLTDPDLLSFIPRPALALLVIIPLTPSWHEARTAEDKDKSEYAKKGDEDPVIWFKQTIGNACGSIGLLHCIINSPVAAAHIAPDSTLDAIRNEALDKKIWERAKVLEENEVFEEKHKEASQLGDTVAPEASEYHLGQHFVAFVKGKDGHLWELEGGRMGPLDRGVLAEDEDVLSERALEMGLGRLMRIESEKGGDLRFSATALAESLD